MPAISRYALSSGQWWVNLKVQRYSAPDAVDVIMQQWAIQLPDLDVSPVAVFGRLHRTFVRYQDLISPVVERHGMTMAMFAVLTALRRSGKPFRLAAGELARQTLITTGGMTLRIDKLVQEGLVVRERDANDGRIVYVRLTPDGVARTEAVIREHFANERRMLMALSAVEARQLAQLLSKLEQSLQLAEHLAGRES